jgi:hypothetical protein
LSALGQNAPFGCRHDGASARGAYAFHLVRLSIVFAAILTVQTALLEFFPMPKGGVGFGLRLALDLAVPPVFFGLLGFAIWLAIATILAAAKRRSGGRPRL